MAVTALGFHLVSCPRDCVLFMGAWEKRQNEEIKRSDIEADRQKSNANLANRTQLCLRARWKRAVRRTMREPDDLWWWLTTWSPWQPRSFSLGWKSEPWNLEQWHHHLKCHRTQTQKPLSWKLRHTDELLMVIRASRTWALFQYSVSCLATF